MPSTTTASATRHSASGESRFEQSARPAATAGTSTVPHAWLTATGMPAATAQPSPGRRRANGSATTSTTSSGQRSTGTNADAMSAATTATPAIAAGRTFLGPVSRACSNGDPESMPPVQCRSARALNDQVTVRVTSAPAPTRRHPGVPSGRDGRTNPSEAPRRRRPDHPTPLRRRRPGHRQPQLLGAGRRPGDPVGVRARARGARRRPAPGSLRPVHRRQGGRAQER